MAPLAAVQVHAPLGHVVVHVALAPQVILQPPAGQSRWTVDWDAASIVQFPESQVRLHCALAPQVSLQLPLLQPLLHVDWLAQLNSHWPSAQSVAHLALAPQVLEQRPLLQWRSQVEEAAQPLSQPPAGQSKAHSRLAAHTQWLPSQANGVASGRNKPCGGPKTLGGAPSTDELLPPHAVMRKPRRRTTLPLPQSIVPEASKLLGGLEARPRARIFVDGDVVLP